MIPGSIFDVSELEYTNNESYEEFYLRFRDVVSSKLRPAGFVMRYMDNTELEEEEKMLPTLEEMTLLWCLDKIDRKLPQLMCKAFSHKISQDATTTLKDLQSEIFQCIPEMLEQKVDILQKRKLHETDLELVKKDCHQILTKTEEVNIFDEEIPATFKEELLEVQVKYEDEVDMYEENNQNNSDDIEPDFIETKATRNISIDQYFCEFCDKILDTRIQLQSHMKNRHKPKFICKPCDLVLGNQKLYEVHRKMIHTSEYTGSYFNKTKKEPHLCRYCHQKFDNHYDLKNHTHNHLVNDEIRVSELYYYKAESKNEVDYYEDYETNDCNDESLVDDIKGGNRQDGQTSDNLRICDICGKSVNTKNMKMHMKSHATVNESFYCKICDIHFPAKRQLFMHKRAEHKSNEVVASCAICGQTFTNAASLSRHTKMHEIVRDKLQCETCKRTFYGKKALGSHVCKHYSCDLCGEKFQRIRNLEMHKKIHLGEEVIQCSQCESIFKNRKRLREHVRESHEKEKKYVCQVCGKKCISKSVLVDHTRIHTGEEPYKCDECGKCFKQRGNLKTHKLVHSDAMPLECQGCKTRFRQLGDLKRHREFHKCGFSQDDFYNSNELQKDVES